MRLVWRETALDDLDRIVTYIGQRDFEAALKLQALIEDCTERLCEHPYMFRKGRVSGTREAVVHPNYLIVYRVGVDSVEIVNIHHSRRQYPPEQ